MFCFLFKGTALRLKMPGYASQGLREFRVIHDGDSNVHIPANTKFCVTFVQCRTNVEDVGPTLYKCYTNVCVC